LLGVVLYISQPAKIKDYKWQQTVVVIIQASIGLIPIIFTIGFPIYSYKLKKVLFALQQNKNTKKNLRVVSLVTMIFMFVLDLHILFVIIYPFTNIKIIELQITASALLILLPEWFLVGTILWFFNPFKKDPVKVDSSVECTNRTISETYRKFSTATQ